ncbi:MAG: hypothetical protein EGQ88_00615 [Prevotellamassilia timonensis]|nr:hypothetical protein [Prevotellamassilia timonensis]
MKYLNIILAPLRLILNIIRRLAKNLRTYKTPKEFTPVSIMMSSFLKSSYKVLGFILITATLFTFLKLGNSTAVWS